MTSFDSLLELRPVRPTDRERVMEISSEVWEGTDYLPEVFDEWVADPGGQFQAAELDGVVVGVQRVRPIAPQIVFYGGLRVALSHRRQGVARSMLRLAMTEAAAQGFREMRLVTGNPDAMRLFESEGFGELVRCRSWFAPRLEGGDMPRMASPAGAEALARQAAGGVTADWHGPLDVDAGLIGRLAQEGLVRTGPGGRAFALLLEPGRARLGVSFVAGSGAALRELLEGLRVEADGMGLRGVRLWTPETHFDPKELEAVGYHLEGGYPVFVAYARPLSS
jgi:GNAT superfamily N-acetyltransferase